MRLLHCISSVNPVHGGPSETLRRRVEVMNEFGIESEVVCLDGSENHWVEEIGCKVHALGKGCFGNRVSFAWGRWLRANGVSFDCVFISGLWQITSVGTYRAISGRVPYYIFPHGMLDPWFREKYPFKHFLKSVYWLFAERFALKGAAGVLFTSEEERRRARGCFWPYECRERVVDYGICGNPGNAADQRRRFMRQFPLLRGRKIALFLGRFHEKKGVDLLLRAFSRLRSEQSLSRETAGWVLVLAGPDDGVEAARCRRLVDTLGLGEYVCWTGMLAGEVKWGALCSATAFVLPSHQENFGVAVAEALSCGLPVYISDKVNIWRDVVQAGAGFAAADDLEGTEHLLSEMFQLDSVNWTRCSNSAIRLFRERYGIRRSVRMLVDMVEADMRRVANGI